VLVVTRKRNEELVRDGLETVIPSYAPSLVLARGEGARVWDVDGREYVDLLAGIAVNVLGHCHPRLVAKVSEQLGTLGHISNLYFSEPQIRLQRALVERTCGERVYFCNSGAEANEAALKLARRYHAKVVGRPRPGFVAMKNSFHGRTYGAVTATGQPAYHDGFEPLVPGFGYATFNDLGSVEALVDEDCAAVILECVQGEGGVLPGTPEFLQGVEGLCRERGALLILDEVQTGIGRTGTFCAHEQLGVRPDIVTLAKGLGGGLPIGAMLCTAEVGAGFVPGSHASTFGGNPVVTAAGLAVLEVMDEEGLLDNAREMGRRLADGLRTLAQRHSRLGEVRGMGLMLAVTCEGDTKSLMAASREAGVLHNTAGGQALRFLPPLNVRADDIDEGLTRLETALLQWGAAG
jgi:acetylornithine/N-succinyldiaminopimelate aminotransferase